MRFAVIGSVTALLRTAQHVICSDAYANSDVACIALLFAARFQFLPQLIQDRAGRLLAS